MSTTNKLLKLSDNFDTWRDKLNTHAHYTNKLFNIVSPALLLETCELSEVGDIIGVNTATNGKQYIKAKNPKTIVGVYYDTCTNTAIGDITIGEVKNTYILVSTTGVVNAKIIGSIKIGDEIVLSTTPGVGRKYKEGTDRERDIIGYALETNTSSEVKLVKIKI